jgi:hypothetical protein
MNLELIDIVNQMKQNGVVSQDSNSDSDDRNNDDSDSDDRNNDDSDSGNRFAQDVFDDDYFDQL